jgi:transposase
MRLRRSRLTDEQTERLLEHFVAGTPARAAAGLAGVNRNTARQFYHRMRELIAQQLERANPLQGEFASAGNNLAGVERRKGARRRAVSVPIFGLYARDGKVHTVLVRNEQSESAPPAPEAGVRLDAIVYADTYAGRAALDVSGFRHRRIGEAKRIARGRPQIDSIESFWSQAKRHLRRYNGIPSQHLHLFLKECEWRFNYGTPTQLLKVLRAWICTFSA